MRWRWSAFFCLEPRRHLPSQPLGPDRTGPGPGECRFRSHLPAHRVGRALRHAGGALFASGSLSGKRRESASGAPMPQGKGTATIQNIRRLRPRTPSPRPIATPWSQRKSLLRRIRTSRQSGFAHHLCSKCKPNLTKSAAVQAWDSQLMSSRCCTALQPDRWIS